MEALKVTKAREIIKESVTEAETLVVNGVAVSKPSEHQMQAGDFYFRRDCSSGFLQDRPSYVPFG